ncbi:MAG: class I SAM-dependent methyltransferase [bacterium]|nr:class I SAM-dependent methyltransferase [bacterium]
MPVNKVKFAAFSPEVVEIHEMFRAQPASEHIAKPPTLEALFQVCQANDLKRVLELGGGLGTISRLLLKYSNAQLDIYEHDVYFRDRLRENLAEFTGRYQILSDYRTLPPHRDYDLVVVDGGHSRKDAPGEASGFNAAIWFYLNYLQSAPLVYVEGKRHIQRLWARKAIAKRYIYSLQRFADTEYLGELASGGVLIHKVRSAIFPRRLLNFIFWEIIEGNTVRNHLSFRLRKLTDRFKI